MHENTQPNQPSGYPGNFNFPRITLIFAGIFIVLGVCSYVFTGTQSITALIPAFFGLLLVGTWAISKKNLALGGHLSPMIALLGLLGTFRSLGKVPALFMGQPLERPMAVAVQAIFAVLSLVFILISVQWFLNNRKTRS